MAKLSEGAMSRKHSRKAMMHRMLDRLRVGSMLLGLFVLISYFVSDETDGALLRWSDTLENGHFGDMQYPTSHDGHRKLANISTNEHIITILILSLVAT